MKPKFLIETHVEIEPKDCDCGLGKIGRLFGRMPESLALSERASEGQQFWNSEEFGMESCVLYGFCACGIPHAFEVTHDGKIKFLGTDPDLLKDKSSVNNIPRYEQ